MRPSPSEVAEMHTAKKIVHTLQTRRVLLPLAYNCVQPRLLTPLSTTVVPPYPDSGECVVVKNAVGEKKCVTNADINTCAVVARDKRLGSSTTISRLWSRYHVTAAVCFVLRSHVWKRIWKEPKKDTAVQALWYRCLPILRMEIERLVSAISLILCTFLKT